MKKTLIKSLLLGASFLAVSGAAFAADRTPKASEAPTPAWVMLLGHGDQIVTISPDRAVYIAAAIDPEFQNAGLYLPLLQHGLRITMQSGCRYLVAAVGDELLELYKTMGFRIVDSRTVEPKPGWRFQSHLIYIDGHELGDQPPPANRIAATMNEVASFVGA